MVPIRRQQVSPSGLPLRQGYDVLDFRRPIPISGARESDVAIGSLIGSDLYWFSAFERHLCDNKG